MFFNTLCHPHIASYTMCDTHESTDQTPQWHTQMWLANATSTHLFTQGLHAGVMQSYLLPRYLLCICIDMLLEVVWLICRLSEGTAWGPNHNILVGGSCSGIESGRNSEGIEWKRKSIHAQWNGAMCLISMQVDMLCSFSHYVTVRDLAVHINCGRNGAVL